MDLIEFLRARLEEIAQAARDTSLQAGTSRWQFSVDDNTVTSLGSRGEVVAVVPAGVRAGRHIAMHNPEIVLREVAAKQRIIDAVNLAFNDAGEPILPGGYGECYWDVVRLLALPFADHPDYRHEWRP